MSDDNDRKQGDVNFSANANVKVSSTSSNDQAVDLQLSRKAYQLVCHKNPYPEITHLLEASHHTAHDQKHHVKVPLALTTMMRHMIDQILRDIAKEQKKGRGDYGAITIKNIRACLTKLHV